MENFFSEWIPSAPDGAEKDPLAGLTDTHYVLLIEDNPADARLIIEAFAEIGMKSRCLIAATPAEALATLESSGSGGMLPCVVLLNGDLNGGRGSFLLKQMKTTDHLCEIPVIVMTDNDKTPIIRRLYRQYANACVVKPTSFEGYVTFVENLVKFWFQSACLPPAF